MKPKTPKKAKAGLEESPPGGKQYENSKAKSDKKPSKADLKKKTAALIQKYKEGQGLRPGQIIGGDQALWRYIWIDPSTPAGKRLKAEKLAAGYEPDPDGVTFHNFTSGEVLRVPREFFEHLMAEKRKTLGQ